MRNYTKFVVFFILISTQITGCGLRTIQREIDLPPQELSNPLTDDSKVRLIIYNNTDLTWLNEVTGEMNVSIDGKGVCKLNINDYVIIETNNGTHTIDLEHWDMVPFVSSHQVSLDAKENYLQVYCLILSNGADLTEKPKSFESQYSAIEF